MALEQAGVSLEAENFNKYIKRLQTIEKRQREVFDTKFKGTGLSFQQVTKAAKDYDAQLQKVDRANKQNQQSTLQFGAAAKTLAVGALAAVTAQIGQLVSESAQLAARFQGQQTGLNNLAASFRQSGSAIQSSIQTASKGTVSGLQAIQAANQGLLLGVARTPEEFDKLTTTALTLGRTMGLTGTQAIEQFTTALGRRSLLILDNFGISAKQVNAEVESLAQVKFGKLNSQLDEAQKNAVFMEAALKIASEAAGAIGEEAGEAQASFERLAADSENLKVTFGEVLRPSSAAFADALSRAAQTAQQLLAIVGALGRGLKVVVLGSLDRAVTTLKNIGRIIKGEPTEAVRDFSNIFDLAFKAQNQRFKEIASTIAGVDFGEDKIMATIPALDDQGEAIDDNTDSIKAFEQAVKQAEQLQLQFAREAEDIARKRNREIEDLTRNRAREAEDIERNTNRQISRLGERQSKDREKLLKSQQKQLDKFEVDRKKQISSAEKEIAKERKRAETDRLRAQEQLQRQLKQAADRFRLSQIQGERRFQLSERRLRAEGDILALQELREDRALQVQEEKENFNLSQSEAKDNASQQQKINDQDLGDRLNELKTSLEEQRAELLTSFDEQLRAQEESQAEQRAELQRGLAEQQEERRISFQRQEQDRTIALQREEEDRRISQARQLQDLGRSFADQKGVTEQGVTAIAGELEKVFGTSGVAENIITGFSDRTQSEFKTLFDNIAKIARETKIPSPKISVPSGFGSSSGSGSGRRKRLGGPQEFHEGGIIGGPGPIGSPQTIQALKGETVLPTHKQSFTMNAPVIPSQNLNVNMSGGFNIEGGEQAGQETIQAAIVEMTDTLEIAIRRLARRN
jgi:hypothetical protein